MGTRVFVGVRLRREKLPFGIKFLALNAFRAKRNSSGFAFNIDSKGLEIWPKHTRRGGYSVFPSFSSNSPTVFLGTPKNRFLAAQIAHVCHDGCSIA